MKLQILYFLILLCFISCKENNKQNVIDNSLIQNLSTVNDSLKSENKTLIEKSNNIKSEYSWFDSEWDGEQFLKNEINNPEEFIDSKLRENINIIPLEATLGGTMSFDRIQLLGKKWLIADYNDGHLSGKALIEFQLNKRNELSFKIIATETD